MVVVRRCVSITTRTLLRCVVEADACGSISLTMLMLMLMLKLMLMQATCTLPSRAIPAPATARNCFRRGYGEWSEPVPTTVRIIHQRRPVEQTRRTIRSDVLHQRRSRRIRHRARQPSHSMMSGNPLVLSEIAQGSVFGVVVEVGPHEDRPTAGDVGCFEDADVQAHAIAAEGVAENVFFFWCQNLC